MPSSKGSGKRKRTPSVGQESLNLLTPGNQQPSSRDASSEDAADSAGQILTDIKHKKSETNFGPAKRQRTKSHVDGSSDNSSSPVAHDLHRSNAESARKSTDENETPNLSAPPKGVLQDPVGYTTNPPPVGRPVRVYADGVFDLFHLGLVEQALRVCLVLTIFVGTCDNWSKRRMHFQTFTFW